MAPFALVNGKIVTVDERFSVASAIALDGDRVTATGTPAEIRAHADEIKDITPLVTMVGGRPVHGSLASL